MPHKYKSSILFLVLIFLSQIVSADLLLEISPSSPSLNLNHGQSETIRFSITNENKFCSIECSWELTKDNDGIIDADEDSAGPSSPFYISQVFTAPTKDEVKQESGTIQYTLRVACDEITAWDCWASSEKTTSSIITLNYDLTQEEKDAKTYLQSKLSAIQNLLEISESKLFNLNSKIDSLPKNVLISDIKERLNEHEEQYQNQKNTYDYINDLYTKLKFVEAKYSFTGNQDEALEVIVENIGLIDKDVDERLKTHNEVIDNLNDLESNLIELEQQAKVLEQDVADVSSKVNSLIDDFEKGNFQSYESIKSRIYNLNRDIATTLSNIESELRDTLNQGQNFLSIEFSKLEKTTEKNYLLGDGIEGLTNLCNSFSQVKSDFEDYSKEQLRNYNDESRRVMTYNSDIQSINSEISEINELREEIRAMVNDDNIKEKDFSPCQEELIRISEFGYIDLKNIGENDYQTCRELYDEISIIRESKEQHFTFKFMRFLRKLWPFDSDKFEKIPTLDVEKSPPEPELLSLEKEAEKYGERYCDIDLTISLDTLDYVLDIEGQELTTSSIGEIIESENQCCSFGICSKCCEGNECVNDVTSYPVILLHGHAILVGDSVGKSLDVFTELQFKLLEDKYRIGGIFLPDQQKSDMVAGEWGRVKTPITVKATYYYNVFNSEGEIISKPSKQESISEYAKRLEDVVELVKYRTGRNKVNIVAKSMGGLVAREYIKHYGGESSVHKLIMVGTPNHGVQGVSSFCFLGGAGTECSQMRKGSAFLSSLNSGDETYGNVQYYNVIGSGCQVNGINGDGIVRVESAKLEGAKNVFVNGECKPFGGFHLSLPEKPEAYEFIKQFLEE